LERSLPWPLSSRAVRPLRVPMPTDDTFDRLHRLIKKGDVIAVREFIASGVSVDLRNRLGWTPLMLAANEGHTPIVSLLLSEGADVQAVNDFGASALAYAALRGECRTIQALLDAGASLDVRPHGASLLEFARGGDGRFESQRHLELLRAVGAT
jgi:ankyrin repeat protein